MIYVIFLATCIMHHPAVLPHWFRVSCRPCVVSLLLSGGPTARNTSTYPNLQARKKQVVPTSQERLLHLKSAEKRCFYVYAYNPPPLASTQISLQHSFQILALELSKLTCDCIPFCRIAAIAVGSLVVGYITLKVSLSGKHYFFSVRYTTF